MHEINSAKIWTLQDDFKIFLFKHDPEKKYIVKVPADSKHFVSTSGRLLRAQMPEEWSHIRNSQPFNTRTRISTLEANSSELEAKHIQRKPHSSTNTELKRTANRLSFAFIDQDFGYTINTQHQICNYCLLHSPSNQPTNQPGIYCKKKYTKILTMIHCN